jgi:hypothetical protein
VKSAVFVDCAHRADTVALVVFSPGLFGREGEAAEVPLEGGRWFEHVGDSRLLRPILSDSRLCESIVFGMARRLNRVKAARRCWTGSRRRILGPLLGRLKKVLAKISRPLEFAHASSFQATSTRRYASPNFKRLIAELTASQSQTCRSRPEESAKAGTRCLFHRLPRAWRPRQSPAKPIRRVGRVFTPEAASR